MKRLKNPGCYAVPEDNATQSPVVIFIANDSNKDLTPLSGNIIDIDPVHITASNRHESRLQDAIRAEQAYLVETCTTFLAATGAFLGAVFRWLVWRIVLPITVTGILLLVVI